MVLCANNDAGLERIHTNNALQNIWTYASEEDARKWREQSDCKIQNRFEKPLINNYFRTYDNISNIQKYKFPKAGNL